MLTYGELELKWPTCWLYHSAVGCFVLFDVIFSLLNAITLSHLQCILIPHSSCHKGTNWPERFNSVYIKTSITQKIKKKKLVLSVLSICNPKSHHLSILTLMEYWNGSCYQMREKKKSLCYAILKAQHYFIK